MSDQKFNSFDELHITCDSEYGCYFTLIDRLHGIYVCHDFLDEEDLKKIFIKLMSIYEHERERKAK